jgi:hypothetical protein
MGRDVAIKISAAITLLGNISYRLKRELRFDTAHRRFVADEEADAMLKGTCPPHSLFRKRCKSQT